MASPHERTVPLAPYFGGKRRLARAIVERIDAVPHEFYGEPFIGMGNVFLARDRRVKVEAINDLHGDVANLFRVVQRHPQALVDDLRWVVASRALYRRLQNTPAEGLTDVERATRFLVMQRLSYGAKRINQVFRTSHTTRANLDVYRLQDAIAAVHRRLIGVFVEELPWDRFVERYDRSGGLFYLDPPYWGCEQQYGRGLWDRADFERLSTTLRNVEARFIVSLNDVPEIREQFSWARISSVAHQWTVRGRQEVAELLIETP